MIAIMYNDTCKKFLLNIINCFRDLTEIDNDWNNDDVFIIFFFHFWHFDDDDEDDDNDRDDDQEW